MSGPYGARKDNSSAVKTGISLTCVQSVKVKVVYTIEEENASGQRSVVGSGARIISVIPKPGEPACTTGSPCVTAPIDSDTFKVGGALGDGARKFVASATAWVYAAGTVFVGDYPLGGNVLQVANLVPSIANI